VNGEDVRLRTDEEVFEIAGRIDRVVGDGGIKGNIHFGDGSLTTRKAERGTFKRQRTRVQG
jgi:predicted fused transcriptional regulator/phosphomethylpyrimidine kinase